MKKILVFISLIICLVGLSACGTEDQDERPDSNTPTDVPEDDGTEGNGTEGNGTEGDADNNEESDTSKLLTLVGECAVGDTVSCQCSKNKDILLFYSPTTCNEAGTCSEAVKGLQKKCTDEGGSLTKAITNKSDPKTTILIDLSCFCQTPPKSDDSTSEEEKVEE